MIQRVQSIFLALVTVLFILLFFIPVYKIAAITATTADAQLKGMMLYNPLLLVPMSFILIISLIAIFAYKNRKKQIGICRIGLILSMLVTINALVFPQFFVHGIAHENLAYGIGSYFFPADIILFALAARFIKKDDDLVRAADRLR
jgi:hypothetical protein